jgi:hypothetical protein
MSTRSTTPPLGSWIYRSQDCSVCGHVTNKIQRKHIAYIESFSIRPQSSQQ